MERALIWGCGEYCVNAFDNINIFEGVDIVAFVDRKKVGELFNGHKIYSPQMINFLHWDVIIIASQLYFDEIKTELLYSFQVDESAIKFIDDYRVFIQSISNVQTIRKVIEKPLIIVSNTERTEKELSYLFPNQVFVETIIWPQANKEFSNLISMYENDNSSFIVSSEIHNATVYQMLEEKGIHHGERWISDNEMVFLLDKNKSMEESKMYQLMKNSNVYNGVPFCRKPFMHCEVHGVRGEVRPCCPAYMNPIGYLSDDRFDDIWNGTKARLVRLSIMNRTYAFCSKDRCPFMVQIVRDGKIDETKEQKWEKVEALEKPTRLNIATDYSCNLSCPSCRKEVRISDERYRKKLRDVHNRLTEQVFPWLKEVQIAGDGEVFFSPVYRDLIYSGYLKCSLVLVSNGTLITPQNFEPLQGKWKSISLILSMDGIRKNTLEKLRRECNYEKFMQNVEYVSRLRSRGNIIRWTLNFVLQRDNVEEFEEYVCRMKEFGVDEIRILNLLDNGSENVEELRVCDDYGNIKDKYKEYFQAAIFDDSIINWWNINESSRHNITVQ